jgi:hypoxanthine phosphoribosyltransferase
MEVIELISASAIEEKVSELAAKISADHREGELVLVGVLKGAFVFLADLMRKLSVPCECSLIGVSSYESGSTSSGRVKLTYDINSPIEGKSVLIVEDIVDTGLTLHFLKRNLSLRHPKEIKVCALLDKPQRREAEVEVEYVGFTVPDRFVVGYGLDYDEKYRDLPYIGYIEGL